MKSNTYMAKQAITRWLLCLAIAAGLGISSSFAQLAATYPLTISSGAYSSINGIGTQIPTLSADDVGFNIIGLSPGFTVNGVTYTNARMCSNGWVALYGATAPTTGTSYTSLSTAMTNGAVIFCPFNRDLNGVGGTAWWQTSGGVHTFEWNNFTRFGGTDILNFQLKLNTNDGSIQFIYGSCTQTTTTLSNPQVGWKTNGTVAANWATDVNNLYINITGSPTTCDWSNAVTGNANSSNMYFSSSNLAVKPNSGLTYSWTPKATPSPVRTFGAVAGITSNGATISWTAPAGATQYNVQYKTPASCTWTNWSGNPVAATSVALTGLTATTTYQVRVQSSNGTDNSIYSHTPTGAGGTGTDGNNATGTFTTLAAVPIVTSFSPSIGCANSQLVTISGNNFIGVTSVKFGGVNAASFTVVNAGSITATPGASASGVITVTNAAGTGTSGASFTINPAPASTPFSNPPGYCATGGGPVTLFADAVDNSAIYSYLWSDSQTGYSVNENVTQTTVFSVTVTDLSTGCTSVKQVAVGVFTFPTTGIQATATPAGPICPNTTTQLNIAGFTAESFSVTSIPYAAVASAPAGAVTLANAGAAVVPLSGGSLDDGGWGGIPIGFNYNFFGNTFNNLGVGTNGLVMFGTIPGYGTGTGQLGQFSFVTSPQVFPNAGNPGNVIGLMLSDMQFGNASSSLKYWTEGVAPVRRFVLSGVYAQFSGGALTTVQMMLYETTGIIEVHIASSAATIGRTVGLQDATKTIGALAPGWNARTTTLTVPEAWRFTPPSTYNYLWTSVPAGLFSTPTNIGNPTGLAAPAGTTGVYTVVVTNSVSQCTRSYSVSVDVLNPVTPAGGDVTGATTATCGDVVTLTSSGAPNLQWQYSTDGFAWNAIAGQTSSSTNISTPTYGAGTFYFRTMSTEPSCGVLTSTSTPLTLVISPAPSATIGTISGPTVATCGDNLTYSLDAVFGNLQWQVSADNVTFTDVPGATTNPVTRSTNLLGPGTFYVRAKSTVSVCAPSTEAFSNVITLVVSPAACSLLNPTPSICAGTSAVLTAQGNAPYLWSTGATTQSITVSPLATTNYSVNCGTPASSVYNYLVNNTGNNLRTILSPGAGPSGDDAVLTGVPIGFSFTFFGVAYSSVNISTNGNVQFSTSSTSFSPSALPAAILGPSICAPWNDLNTGGGGSVTYGLDAAGEFVISWNTVAYFSGGGTMNSQIILKPNGQVEIQVDNISNTSSNKVMGVNDGNTVGVSPAGRGLGTWSVSSPEGWAFTPVAPGGGCVCTATTTVIVHGPIPVASVTPSASACPATPRTLAAAVTGVLEGPLSYLWSNSNTNSSFIDNPLLTSTYTVTVSDGSCTATSSVSTPVWISPTVSATNGGSYCTPAVPLGATVTADLSAAGTTAYPPPPGGAYSVTSIPYATAGSGGGTTIPTGDDVVFGPFPIGFSFTYFGTTYSQVWISTNGFINFSGNTSAACCSGGVLPAAYANMIALTWNDLNSGAGGSISYETFGTDFIVSFNGVPNFAGGGSPLTGQIILHGATNSVELQISSYGNDGSAATEGISDPTGAFGTTVAGRNSVAYSVSTPEGYLFEPPSTTSLTYTWVPALTCGVADCHSGTALLAGNAAPYVYTVTVSDIHGCTATSSTGVVVNQAPNIVTLQSTTLAGGIPQSFPNPPNFLDIPNFTTATTCDKIVNYNVNITGIPAPAVTHSMTGATTVAAGTAGTGTGTTFGRAIPSGRTTVNVVATNGCGSINKTFRVTVTDNVAPVITPIQVLPTGTNGGECNSLVQVTQPDLINGGLFDNCPNSSLNWVSRSDGRGQFDPYTVGTTVVTWVATDASLNTSTATQNVVVTNFKPLVTSFVANAGNVIFVGQSTTFTVNFTDEDGGGTHTIKFYRDKNDASPSDIKTIPYSPCVNCSGNKNYTMTSAPILYSTSEVAEPKVEIIDGCNQAADQVPGVTTVMYLAVAVAGQQFTTAGGHFVVPAGATAPGNFDGYSVNIGNVCKKATTGNSFKGQLEMNVHVPNAADWRVHTDNGTNVDITWDYLTIGGCSLATFKGACRVNGQTGYKVLVQQSDKDRNPATSNFIRVKVTTNAGVVVFDTQPGLTEALTAANGGAAAIIVQLDGGTIKVQPASGCTAKIDDADMTDKVLQNIPNPFTGQTEIRFNVPEDGKYTLTVYNYLGQEVATLFNAEATTGSTYSVTFDGSNYDAGIYTYTLRSANVTETRRMNLVK